MTYAINTVTPSFVHEMVANSRKFTFADLTADSTGQDLGGAGRWMFQCLLKVKASNNTFSAALVFAENSALTTNPVRCGQSGVLGSALLGTLVLTGVCDDDKQYFGIDVTLGGTATYDAVVYLSRLS